MRRMIKQVILVSVVVLTTIFRFSTSYAQTFPITVNPIVTPPYTPNISDYISAGDGKMAIILSFNDFNKPYVDVYLKISLESQGIKINTSSNYKPFTAIRLIPGIPVTLKGDDIARYFDVNNIDLTGMTSQAYSQSPKLPDGFYTFCVRAYEFNSDILLSNKGCSYLNIKQVDPPSIISPTCKSMVVPASPQSVLFQWQLNNVLSSSVEYQLTIWEVTDLNADAQTAVENNQVVQIFQSSYQAPATLLYDSKYSSLETGKKYAFRVKAKDKDNKIAFLNNGESQICWFIYGYSTGGTIALASPEDSNGFARTDIPLFKWDVPGNKTAGQSVTYYFKIAKLNDNQDIDKAIDNTAWYEETTQPTTSMQGWSIRLTKEMEKDQKYVWQVTAKAGDQTIASSKVQMFTGPPFLQSFYAGNHEVIITTLTNKNFNSLAGKGKIKISDKGDETVNVTFSNLKVKEVAGLYVLESGSVSGSLKMDDIELTPFYDDNGKAVFTADSFKLNKDELAVGGILYWDLPFPTTSKDKAQVVTKHSWFNYNAFKLNGVAVLNDKNEYDLLDPTNFKLKLDTRSDFVVADNKFKQRFFGFVYLPDKVLSQDGQRHSFEFIELEQLFYNEIPGKNYRSDVRLLANTNYFLHPTKFILDLSDDQSPAKLNSTTSWKGVYFEKFSAIYDVSFDNSKQLEFKEKHSYVFELTTGNNYKAWISEAGLDFKLNKDFSDEDEIVTFNKFSAKLTEFNLTIERNEVKSSKVSGKLIIAFLDENNYRVFTIPMDNKGLKTGYLNATLDGFVKTHNPDGGEQKMILTIKRAVFSDNERLDLTIDLEIPSLNVKISSISDFRIYGDLNIGFGKVNGAKFLDNQVKTEYEGFKMTIDKLGASFYYGNYVLSFSALMNLGDDVAGEDGPPRFNVSSATALDDPPDNVLPDLSNPPEVPVNIDDDYSGGTEFAFDPVEVNLNSSIAEFTGKLAITKDDPLWGTSFQGSIKGKIKMPATIEMGASMILGVTPSDMTYWYFDAFFNDQQGTGIPVFGLFNITAMEGRVYRHMSFDSKTKELKIDADLEFGAGLYMQLIDGQAKGQLMMSDVAAELEVRTGGFKVQLEGDISMLNMEARKPGTSNFSKALTKTAAKEAAMQALSQIDDFETSFSVGSGELGITIGTTKAGISYTEGSDKFEFSAVNSATPEASATVKLDGYEFSLKGNASGAGSISLKDGSNEISIGASATGGSFTAKYADYATSVSYNPTQKAASLSVAIGSQKIMVAADAKNDSGAVEFQYSPTKRIYASAAGTGKGRLTFSYDDVNLDLGADKTEKSGIIKVGVGSSKFGLSGNATKGTGSFEATHGGYSYKLAAGKNGTGEFLLDMGSQKIGLSFDKPNGEGSITLQDGATKKLKVGLNASGQGLMDLTYNDGRFFISGDKSTGSGKIIASYDDVEIETEADKSKGTGMMVYRYGNDSMYGAITDQKFAIAYAYAGHGLYLDADAQGNGKIGLTKGEHQITIGGNIVSKKAKVNYSNSSFSIGLTTDYEMDFALGSDSLQVKYKSDTVYIYVYSGGTLANTLANASGSWSKNIGSTKATVDISSGTYSLKIDYSGESVKLTVDNSKNGSVEYTSGSNVYSAAYSGGDYILKANSRQLTYTSDKKLIVKESSAKSLTLTSDGIALKYDDYDVSFSKTKAVSFSDGTRSFALSTTEFSITEGSNKLAIVSKDNVKSVQLTDGTNELLVSNTSASIKYGDFNMGVGGTDYLSVAYGSYTFKVGDNGASYSDDNVSVGFANNTNLFDFKYGTTDVTFSNDKNLKVTSGDYSATLNSDMTFEFSDGTRTLSSGGDNLIKYAESGSYIALQGRNGSYGVKAAYSDYAIGVTASKGNKAELYVDASDYGKFSISGDANKKLKLKYEYNDDDLIISKTSGKIDVTGSLVDNVVKAAIGEEVKVEELSGYDAPDMNGPKYLTTKITDGTGGRVKGNIKMYYNSAESHLICSGAVKGEAPICVQGSFGIDVKGDKFKVEIGREPDAERIKIYPTCSGFGGEGWFYLDNNRAQIGVGGGFKAGGSLDLGVIELWAKAEALILAKVGFQYQPTFEFQEAGIYARLYGGCGGTIDMGLWEESFTIAEVELIGTLYANFQESYVKGDLSGHVEALGGLIDESFSMGFNMSI